VTVRPRRWRPGMLWKVAVLIAATVPLGGCNNSILRNAAEAGVETALERPLPTPTAARTK